MTKITLIDNLAIDVENEYDAHGDLIDTAFYIGSKNVTEDVMRLSITLNEGADNQKTIPLNQYLIERAMDEDEAEGIIPENPHCSYEQQVRDQFYSTR